MLGLFSFAKFLMYRDLDPETWPANAKLGNHELIRPLVSDGFGAGLPLLPEDEPVDVHVPPLSKKPIDQEQSAPLPVSVCICAPRLNRKEKP